MKLKLDMVSLVPRSQSISYLNAPSKNLDLISDDGLNDGMLRFKIDRAQINLEMRVPFWGQIYGSHAIDGKQANSSRNIFLILKKF